MTGGVGLLHLGIPAKTSVQFWHVCEEFDIGSAMDAVLSGDLSYRPAQPRVFILVACMFPRSARTTMVQRREACARLHAWLERGGLSPVPLDAP